MFGNMIKALARRQEAAPKRHALLDRLSDTVDAYAAYRMQTSVPAFELRRADRTNAERRQQLRQVTAH
jgi:hypothetical protein